MNAMTAEKQQVLGKAGPFPGCCHTVPPPPSALTLALAACPLEGIWQKKGVAFFQHRGGGGGGTGLSPTGNTSWYLECRGRARSHQSEVPQGCPPADTAPASPGGGGGARQTRRSAPWL